MKERLSFFLLVIVAALAPLPAQVTQDPAATASSEDLAADLPGTFEALSPGFDNIVIGMSWEEVDAALQISPFFRYTGRPDLSFRSGSQDPILYVEGLQYVQEAYFQFREDRLYSITISMNTKLIDYGTFFRSFRQRFGDPLTLDPSSANWEGDGIRINLEKPLSVQYLDLAVFQRIREEAGIQSSAGQYSRDLLLEAF